jgi:Flp pilus assembly pilin Flp
MLLNRLWHDESGVIITAELMLIATILAIGLVAGLSSLRDAIVVEMADVGQAIGNSNQSFMIGGVTSPSANTAGSGFSDALDFGDGGVGNNNSRGVVIATGVTGGEGTAGTFATND